MVPLTEWQGIHRDHRRVAVGIEFYSSSKIITHCFEVMIRRYGRVEVLRIGRWLEHHALKLYSMCVLAVYLFHINRALIRP